MPRILAYLNSMPKKKPAAAPSMAFVNYEELSRGIAIQIANARDMAELARLMRHQAIEMRQDKRQIPGPKKS
jgi:hypothetical protein